MRLIVDIPDEVYFNHIDNEEVIRHVCEKDIITGKKKDKKTYASIIQIALLDGTPIPNNATNGDAIKALYPNRTFFNEDSCCVTMKEQEKTEEDAEYLTYIDFDGDWWNAQYKGASK